MMITPRQQDAYHKTQLLRLLTGIIDQQQIANQLCFKGGTCAAMLGYLDRFSIDLDFDQLPGTNLTHLKSQLHQLFSKLNLTIKDESQTTLLFLLHYPAQPNQRNTIKLDAVDYKLTTSDFHPQYLPEIDRYANCHTIETMFANKLVALIDRFEKHNSIAGRDLYDIHHFFIQGYRYKPEIIRERRGTTPKEFLQQLIEFIQRRITQTVINQDLNTTLPQEKFQQIRHILKQETLVLLNDELKRLT